MHNVVEKLRWRDPQSRIHAVEEATLALDGILLWTRCGLCDVPEGHGRQIDDALTCAACRIWVDMEPYLDPDQEA